MSDLYLEALQNYLNGPEWRSSIDDFIRTYCQYFVQINNTNHHHHHHEEEETNYSHKGSKLISTFDLYSVIIIYIIFIYIMIITIFILIITTIIMRCSLHT